MKGITKRQRELVDFIGEFIRSHQYSPSYQEIMKHFGFSSLGSVYKHVQVLKRKGLVTSEDNCSRSLNLAKQSLPELSPTNVEVAIIGYLSADNPIETFPQVQPISLPALLAPNPDSTYVLQARGDSLVQEHIMDGDLVILEATSEAAPGDMVVAIVDSKNTIVMRYYPEGQHIRLRSYGTNPANLLVQPDRIAIQGIVTGVLRVFN